MLFRNALLCNAAHRQISVSLLGSMQLANVLEKLMISVMCSVKSHHRCVYHDVT